VLYAPNAQAAAREVGQELDISQIEPLSQESQAVSADADVVVVVGNDQAE
jgi:hypothetical protein